MGSGFRAVLMGLAAGAVIMAGAGTSLAQQEDESAASLQLKLGKEMFMKYCATCHGPNATGDGVASSLFVKKPPNLTLLSKNNGGKFPMMKVIGIVKGDAPIAAHGQREMPVWGEIIGKDKTQESMYGQDAANARILTIGNYLKSIQVQ